MRTAHIAFLTGLVVALAGGAAEEPFYPKLDLSIYPAGKNSEEGSGIALDAAGNIYVTGTTRKAENPGDFPAAGGIPPSTADGLKVFIGKLDPTATRWIYATYLGPFGGASGDAAPIGIGVDRAGNAYVAGNAGDHGFIYKINAAGSAIVYSRSLGGRSKDRVAGLAVDSEGNAYIAGYTISTDFPTTRGALKTTLAAAACPVYPDGRCGDGFVVKLNAAGDVVYSTYLGGSQDDEVTAIAVDQTGSAYVAGRTQSADFPTAAGAFQPALRTGSDPARVQDGFVVKLNPAGSGLRAATFLGGAGSDGVGALALDAAGMAYAGGYTNSLDFPVKNAYQPAIVPGPGNLPGNNGFFAKFDPGLSELLYSTYLDGMTSGPSALSVDRHGTVFAVGTSQAGAATRLPMKRAFQGAPFLTGCLRTQVTNQVVTSRPCFGAYLLALAASGSELAYSTYLGGENHSGRGVAVDEEGNVYLTGRGVSHFPVLGAYPVDSGSLYVAKVGRGPEPAPYASARSIVNSASYEPLQIPALPGTLVTIFGNNLTSASGVVAPERYPLPTELAGTQVLYNGIPTPILAAANREGLEQINLQIPYGSTSWDGTPAVCCGFEIRRQGVSGYAPQPPREGSGPSFVGVFSVVPGTPAIQRAVDYSLVTEENPARRGEVIIVYAAGLGKVEPPVPSGSPAPVSPLSRTSCPYYASLTLYGIRADALFAGLVPGFVGVYQVNVRVPEDLPPGLTRLALASEPCPYASSSAVYIPVQ